MTGDMVSVGRDRLRFCPRLWGGRGGMESFSAMSDTDVDAAGLDCSAGGGGSAAEQAEVGQDCEYDDDQAEALDGAVAVMPCPSISESS